MFGSLLMLQTCRGSLPGPFWDKFIGEFLFFFSWPAANLPIWPLVRLSNPKIPLQRNGNLKYLSFPPTFLIHLRLTWQKERLKKSAEYVSLKHIYIILGEELAQIWYFNKSSVSQVQYKCSCWNCWASWPWAALGKGPCQEAHQKRDQQKKTHTLFDFGLKKGKDPTWLSCTSHWVHIHSDWILHLDCNK